LSVTWWSKTKHRPQFQALQEHSLRQAGEFQKSPAHLALELEPDQEQVSAHGGPDLDEHSILGSAVKGLDLQVLLDEAEKDLDLPAFFVDVGDGLGRPPKNGWCERRSACRWRRPGRWKTIYSTILIF
jgi:hypothetical protein